MYPVLSRPKSRGKISLRSTDPNEYPRIEPNYLSNPDDIQLLIEGNSIMMAALYIRDDYHKLFLL